MPTKDPQNMVRSQYAENHKLLHVWVSNTRFRKFRQQVLAHSLRIAAPLSPPQRVMNEINKIRNRCLVCGPGFQIWMNLCRQVFEVAAGLAFNTAIRRKQKNKSEIILNASTPHRSKFEKRNKLLVYGVHDMICVPFWYLRPPTGNRSAGLITRNATTNGRQQQMRYGELVLDMFDYSNHQKLFWFMPDVCNEHGLCHGKALFFQKEVRTPKCEDLWFVMPCAHNMLHTNGFTIPSRELSCSIFSAPFFCCEMPVESVWGRFSWDALRP